MASLLRPELPWRPSFRRAPRGSRAASLASSVGLRAPPPLTRTRELLHPARSIASAIVAAVSSVSVAAPSSTRVRPGIVTLEKLRAEPFATGRFWSACEVYGSANMASSASSRGPRSEHAVAIASSARRSVRDERIEQHIARARIEGEHLAGRAAAGKSVTFAIPPRLSATRSSSSPATAARRRTQRAARRDRPPRNRRCENRNRRSRSRLSRITNASPICSVYARAVVPDRLAVRGDKIDAFAAATAHAPRKGAPNTRCSRATRPCCRVGRECRRAALVHVGSNGSTRSAGDRA